MKIYQLIKNILKKTIIYKVFDKYRFKKSFIDTDKTLIYIHIGKCGGGTLGDVLNKSHKINKNFENIYRIHIKKPPILKNAKYIIIIRNPISRAISAYNWRHRLIIKEKSTVNRYEFEHQTLSKYQSFDEMCQKLFLNRETEKDFEKIRHLKENINYYIGDLLKKIRSEQVYAIFTKENLNEEIKKFFNIKNQKYIHINSNYGTSTNLKLSEKSKNNLKKFLENDYDCIQTLFKIVYGYTPKKYLELLE